MKDKETTLLTACSKGELAQRYMPNISSSSARRTMRAWIMRNSALKTALIKAGYTNRAVMLTPAQIRIHYQFLGEP